MQSDKFEEEMHGRYGAWLEIITKATSLTDQIGRLLSKHHADDAFIPTEIQFAKVCVETPAVIVRLAKSGDIAPSYVLMRWYLEQTQLLWYLRNNAEEYQKWLDGSQIKPGSVRKYLRSVSLQDMAVCYKDWSNVVHGNSLYLDSYSTIARRKQRNEGQIVVTGQILCCVALLTMKMNAFLAGALCSVATPRELALLDPAFLGIDQSLQQMWSVQRDAEKKLMHS
jgi:hypothetical protein